MLFNIKSRLLFSLKDLSYNISYNEIDARESVCLIPILLPRSTEFSGKRIVDWVNTADFCGSILKGKKKLHKLGQ